MNFSDFQPRWAAPIGCRKNQQFFCCFGLQFVVMPLTQMFKAPLSFRITQESARKTQLSRHTKNSHQKKLKSMISNKNVNSKLFHISKFRTKRDKTKQTEL